MELKGIKELQVQLVQQDQQALLAQLGYKVVQEVLVLLVFKEVLVQQDLLVLLVQLVVLEPRVHKETQVQRDLQAQQAQQVLKVFKDLLT